jgi:glycosyltransferase involved in cell wall biosynthesis
LLHVFPTFATGGAQVRTTDLMKALGGEFEHSVIALDGVATCAERVPPDIRFRVLEGPRRAGTLETVRAFCHLLRNRRPSLLLTYNWGAIEPAMAARLTGCPLLHAEDGFGPEEATRRLPRRAWTRRVVLRGAHGVVVPSRTLERVALEEYHLPPAKVLYVPNAVDTERFQPGKRPEVSARLGLLPGVPVIGSVGHLRAEKNLGLLLTAFSRLPAGSAQLLIVGEGPCRGELQKQASDLGCAARVFWAGAVLDASPYYGAMDVFAMSSATEQMPVALLEAMASRLPAVCTDVGDCAEMLGTRQRPFVLSPGNEDQMVEALGRLVQDAGLRAAAGESNLARCVERYSRESMIRKYREIYRSAARPSA